MSFPPPVAHTPCKYIRTQGKCFIFPLALTKVIRSKVLRGLFQRHISLWTLMMCALIATDIDSGWSFLLVIGGGHRSTDWRSTITAHVLGTVRSPTHEPLGAPMPTTAKNESNDEVCASSLGASLHRWLHEADLVQLHVGHTDAIHYVAG